MAASREAQLCVAPMLATQCTWPPISRCCCRDQANPVHCSSLTADQPLQVLVGLGSALAYAAGGRDLALPFALGGASGMLYQYMLQVGILICGRSYQGDTSPARAILQIGGCVCPPQTMRYHQPRHGQASAQGCAHCHHDFSQRDNVHQCSHLNYARLPRRQPQTLWVRAARPAAMPPRPLALAAAWLCAWAWPTPACASA